MIGNKLGEVLDVDVPNKGVQWGRCLRVRVKINITKKLLRGKKITVENDEQRWVYFRYKRLPNFCYIYVGNLVMEKKSAKKVTHPLPIKKNHHTNMGPGLEVNHSNALLTKMYWSSSANHRNLKTTAVQRKELNPRTKQRW